MSITTLATAIGNRTKPVYIAKGALGESTVALSSSWFSGGFPAAGVADTSTASGVVRSSSSSLVAGQIPFYDPAAGSTYLLKGVFHTGTSVLTQHGAHVFLMDRLLDCGANTTPAALSPTLTTAQAVNTATLPSRDANGSTLGDGVLVALEVSSALGVGTPTFTLSYTNSGTTGGRSATNVENVSASAAVGTFHTFGLQGADTGVAAITSITASATQTTGQWVLVLYRLIASLNSFMHTTPTAGQGVDALTGCFARMFNGSVPFIVHRSNGTAVSPFKSGHLQYTQG